MDMHATNHPPCGTSSLPFSADQTRDGLWLGWGGPAASSEEQNQEPVLSSGARTQLVHTSCDPFSPGPDDMVLGLGTQEPAPRHHKSRLSLWVCRRPCIHHLLAVAQWPGAQPTLTYSYRVVLLASSKPFYHLYLRQGLWDI